MKARKLLWILPALLILFPARFPAQAETAGTDLTQFAAAVQAHAVQLEESFEVPITENLMEQLRAPSAVGGSTILGEITSQAGIFGQYRYSWNNTRMTFHEVTYRSGWRILCCQQSGRTDLLTQRERKTLIEAYSLVNGAVGSDLEKERYIYDELCRRITYEMHEDGSGEKDSAVGGLLNGRADCDGYADSMLLCCGLAEIPCRYIQGDSRKPSALTNLEGGHVWNLIRIGESWLMCDVTWGDSDESGPSYLYFNIGREDAGESYIWEEKTLGVEVASVADFRTQLMADQQPFAVYSLEDVYSAVRSAASEKSRTIMLYSPEKAFWKTDADAFMQMLHRGSVEKCSYHDTGHFFELSGVSFPDHPFCFCDSGEEALAAISSYADRGIDTFSVYFHPDIAGSLFSDDMAGMTALLAMSRIENPGSYRYSAESCVVTFEQASFIGTLPVCAAPEDVKAVIQAEMPEDPSTICFLLDGSDPEEAVDHAMDALAGYGIYSIRYSIVGNRVIIYLR